MHRSGAIHHRRSPRAHLGPAGGRARASTVHPHGQGARDDMQRDRRLVPIQPDPVGVQGTTITLAERIRGVLQPHTLRRTAGYRAASLAAGRQSYGRGLSNAPLQLPEPAPLLPRLPNTQRVHARSEQQQPRTPDDTGPLGGGRSMGQHFCGET